MAAIKVTGIEALKRRLSGLKVDYQRGIIAALYQEGLAILAVSIRRVPVDTGRLRATAYCAPPTDVGGLVHVTLGYGTTYALPVHERTGAHHPVGRDHYLSSAVDEARSGFAERLAQRAKENVRARVGVDAVPAEFPTAPVDPGERPREKARLVRVGRGKGFRWSKGRR